MDVDTSMLVAAWLQGVGTVAAVVVALFLPPVLAWRRRPRFALETSTTDRGRSLVATSRLGVEGHENHHICWLGGLVRVSGGRDVAQNVEVIVQDWHSPSGDQEAPFVHGNSLRWSNSRDDTVRIPNGTWRRVDLLSWMAFATGEPTAPILWIALKAARTQPPRPWFRLVEAGEYRLDLVVVADNARPSRWTLAFTYAPRPVTELLDLRACVQHVRIEPAGRVPV